MSQTLVTEDLATTVAERLRADPRLMTIQLARELRVPEAQIIRHLPEGQSVELDATRWEELIRSFEPLGKVHVISTNSAVTLECFGEFGNFSTWHGYFNVQTKTLDMHIRTSQLDSIFAVRKKSHMDGVDTLSIQFYTPEGSSAFKVFLTFGGTNPPPQKREQFDRIVHDFARR